MKKIQNQANPNSHLDGVHTNRKATNTSLKLHLKVIIKVKISGGLFL